MSEPKQQPIVNARRVVRRNERCPFCTSGIKFKLCHGKVQVSPGVDHLVTAAGHMQERPACYPITSGEALGPMPTRKS